MLFVNNGDVTDPRLNLALEEYLLREINLLESLLLLYVNEPAVVVGRNQNVFEEIDPTFIKRSDVHVVRRLSGGGTVYHDLGNLNYSFITEGQADLHRFKRVLRPVVQVLRDLGVAAEIRGRSDLVVGDRKISGNAQYASRGRMFSHGTLLFDADLDQLNKAIKPAPTQIDSRAVQSVRSSVVNIRQLLPGKWTIADFKHAFLTGIFGPGEPPELRLKPQAWQQVRQIAAERYMSWDWNIGRSPQFTVSRSGHYHGGPVRVQTVVEKGRIKQIEIGESLLGKQTLLQLENAVVGTRYDPDDLRMVLDPLEDELAADSLSVAEFVALLY